MADKLATDPQKLEWSGKLCALLLNDGTNALRWFLKENLPRRRPEDELDFNSILQENRQLFTELRNKPRQIINQEMFDILYGENNEKVDDANLEIYLLFVLIRYLCKLKHLSWKWWNEDPQDHQITPLFDVIRLFRFKERMKPIVHNYEITEAIFLTSWSYATSVLDRLHSYKISSRRWRDDVMKKSKEDQNNYRTLVKAMQWQTLSLSRRQKLYLCLKENRRNAVIKDLKPKQPWSEFVSHFGQLRGLSLSHLDEPKSRNFLSANGCENSMLINAEMLSPAHQLHWLHSNKYDECDQSNMERNAKKKTAVVPTKLLVDEVRILNQITNDVFIKDLQESKSDLFASAAAAMRDLFISRCYKITPFPRDPHYYIHMDNAVFNIDAIQQPTTNTSGFCGDVPKVMVGSKTLPSWREVLGSTPLRLMLSGDRSSGKTTLLKKITYDWATQNSPQLNFYRIVFYIDLALVVRRKPFTSLSECIVEQCLINFSIYDVEEMFNISDGEGILLLFDGAKHMPDASSDVMSEISEVICGKRWAKCSVVLTTNFNQEFEDNAEKELHGNAFYFAHRSSKCWNRFNIVGFTTHDVIMHARHYFELSKFRKICNSAFEARKFLKYCQVFQRDVYKGISSSPTFIFLLASLWKHQADESLKTTFPETLSGIIAPFFAKLEFRESDSDFCEKVLQRSLNGNIGNTYTSCLTSSIISKMQEKGLLQQHDEPMPHVRFTYHLFEEYCAAKWMCRKFVESKSQMERLLVDNLQCFHDVMRLRNFLLFTCFLSKECAEVILWITSNLMSKQKYVNDMKGRLLLEATKHFTLQCFYEMGHVTKESFLTNSTEVKTFEDFQKSGSSLHLKSVNLLSNRSKQALLFLTSKCQPVLNSSGTVFSFTNFSFFWIHSIHFAEMDGSQLEFASSLLRNLPFLEAAIFDGVKNVKDEDIGDLCKGLRHPWTENQTGSVLHSLTFTLKLTSSFDDCQVTTYEGLGQLLENLPYLEELHLTIPSPQLFFSLFNSPCKCVIPLTVINFSGYGITNNDCQQLASIMHRLIFVEKIDLSNNPLKNGFASISQQLRHLRCLEIIDASKACLTSSSIQALSANAESLSKLRHLDVSGNQLHCLESMTSLVLAIERLPCLEYLNLSDNCLGDNVVCSLARSLSHHCNIRVLKLNFVEMGSVALSALKQHLRKCSKLSHLSIAGNYFASDLLQFTEVLKPISSSSDFGLANLEELDMSGASPVTIQSYAINHFLESIKSHKKLRRLALQNVCIAQPHLTLLLEGCERLESLKEVCFSKSLLNLTDKQAKVWTCLKLV